MTLTASDANATLIPAGISDLRDGRQVIVRDTNCDSCETRGSREAAYLKFAEKHQCKRPWFSGKIEQIKCVDADRRETVANLLTCAAFTAAAFAIPKKDRSNAHGGAGEHKSRFIYRCALHALGGAAFIFHAAPERSPRVKQVCRRADYCCVALTYSAFTLARQRHAAHLRTAPCSSHPKEALSWAASARNQQIGLAAISGALLPFQPHIVIGVHTLLTERALLSKAMEASSSASVHSAAAASPAEERRRCMRHLASMAAGLSCFMAENTCRANPYLHPAWHCFGALAIHEANRVLI